MPNPPTEVEEMKYPVVNTIKVHYGQMTMVKIRTSKI